MRLDPTYGMAYLTLGGICMDQDRTQDAVTCFEQYLRFETSPQASEMIAEVKAVIEGLKEELKDMSQ